jgi:proteasome lid subunit RPN8/RPN11
MDSAYAEIGPLAVELDEFRHLKDHVDVFCNGENAVELLFVVTGATRIVENRILGEKILLIPLIYSDRQHASYYHALVLKLSKSLGVVAVGHVHTGSSVKPSDEDVATSVLIDRKIGRPVYHVIMNEQAEFEVYSNGEHLRQLHKPASEN